MQNDKEEDSARRIVETAFLFGSPMLVSQFPSLQRAPSPEPRKGKGVVRSLEGTAEPLGLPSSFPKLDWSRFARTKLTVRAPALDLPDPIRHRRIPADWPRFERFLREGICAQPHSPPDRCEVIVPFYGDTHWQTEVLVRFRGRAPVIFMFVRDLMSGKWTYGGEITQPSTVAWWQPKILRAEMTRLRLTSPSK